MKWMCIYLLFNKTNLKNYGTDVLLLCFIALLAFNKQFP